MKKVRFDASSIIFKGKMWITGGLDEAHDSYKSTEFINLNESYDSNLSIAPFLPELLSAHAFIQLNDTTTFLIAGQPENQKQQSVRTYYFHHDSYTFTDGPELNTSRKYHTAGIIKDKVTFKVLNISSFGQYKL